YHSPRPALLGPQPIRLRPADHARARIESHQLLVEPEHRLHWLRDPRVLPSGRAMLCAASPATVIR
ncbi:MAG TPA: transglutaminase N-terminal domain-containing protein, partial [Solirubrobacteraceae bacterium]